RDDLVLSDRSQTGGLRAGQQRGVPEGDRGRVELARSHVAAEQDRVRRGAEGHRVVAAVSGLLVAAAVAVAVDAAAGAAVDAGARVVQVVGGEAARRGVDTEVA